MRRPGGTPLLRAVAALAVLGLGLPVLAGCVVPGPAGASCEAVTVPPLRTGSAVTYRSQGHVSLAGSETLGHLRWEAVDPDEDGPDVSIPNGSRITFSVGAAPTRTVDPGGSRRPTYQITLWVEAPDRPGPIPMTDQMLDADDAQLVQTRTRYSALSMGDVNHVTLPYRWNHTGLLQAPLFWGRTLQEGDTGSIDSPAFSYMGEGLLEGTIEWEVRSVETTPSGCRAVVALVDDGWDEQVWRNSETDPKPERARIVFESGRPLPVRYRSLRYDDVPPTGPDLFLDHVRSQVGHGPPLPAFEPGPLPNRTLETAPRRNLSPAGGDDLWPTSLDRARAVARDDLRIAAWLTTHPSARTTYLEHRMGHPNGSVVDDWGIVWRSADGAMRGASVERLDDSEEDEFRVATVTFNSDEVGYPHRGGEWVTLDALGRLHRQLYGVEPEVLSCNIARGDCDIGTHRGMHTYRSCLECDPRYRKAPFSVGQISVDMERGWYYRDGSFDNRSVPPPAGPMPGGG